MSSAIQAPTERGASAKRGADSQGQCGQGAHVPSRHVSWLHASSSRLPKPAFAVSSNLRHSPGSLKGSIPIQEARQGLHAAVGCQAASRGPQGWPAAASSVWFSPSCPGTSDTVSPWRRPYPGEGTKALHSGAGAGRTQGTRAQLHSRAPQPGRPASCPAPPCISPKAREPAHPTGFLLWPQNCAGLFLAPLGQLFLPNPSHWEKDPGLVQGNTCLEPGVTSTGTHVHTSHLLYPQSHLRSWAETPGSPFQPALQVALVRQTPVKH